MHTRHATRILSAAILAGTFALTADAALIKGDMANSAEGIGYFTGDIEYIATSPNMGSLTVTLLNESEPSNGGFITGFVFNIDSADPHATVSLTSASHPFDGLVNHPAPPFGHSFTAGAALGGHWSGGGNPTEGIGVGQTGTFVFEVMATDSLTLNAGSFLSGPNQFNFVVRLRGFADGGSDKVPAIPGPATIATLGAFVLFGGGRRMRQRFAESST